jgi:hypothetical protein
MWVSGSFYFAIGRRWRSEKEKGVGASGVEEDRRRDNCNDNYESRSSACGEG